MSAPTSSTRELRQRDGAALETIRTRGGVELAFDFDADIRAEYADKLHALGAPVRPVDRVDDLIVRFFSLSHRLIDCIPRAVAWSSELKARTASLPAHYKQALANIEHASLAGDDLNPYQSRDLAKRPWKSDRQLLEWGITHFHLGVEPDAKIAGMVAGTSDLLFVVVRPGVLYFVDIGTHDSFSDQTVFDVATRNWPQLTEHAALSGAVGLERVVTADERQQLRAAGINVLTQGSDGTVYAPVGGGVTTSGAPVHIVRTYLIPRTGPISAWRRMCQKSPENILSMIPEAARKGLTRIELRATEIDEGVIAIRAVNLVGGPMLVGKGYPSFA